MFGHIGDVSVYWLVLALALKTAESAFIGLGWRNILRAAYPKANLSFKTAWGASQGGTAINAVTPAQAGTATMIGIFRTSIPGSSVAGVTSATIVQALFFTAVSVVIVICTAIFRPHTVSKGSPSDESGKLLRLSSGTSSRSSSSRSSVVLVVLWPRLKPRVLNQWRKAKQGAAIFSDWGRYGREVALPSGASYAAGSASTSSSWPRSASRSPLFTVFLVASSHMLSGLFAITPGGVGQTQALDVATLRAYAALEQHRRVLDHAGRRS